MRRELIIKFVVMTAIVVLAATVVRADTFDWRNVGGNNYMTPVKNQGGCGSCWAFGATAALEAAFDIYYDNPDLNYDLSEQHLICAGGMGDCSGGWEFLACDFFRTDGITDEATLPYTASNTSPNWPLTPTYSLYGITANQNWIDNSTAALKTALQTYGPLVCAIYTGTDFFDPTGSGAPMEIPEYYEQFIGDEIGAINHCVAITGWVDDAGLPEGGYWIVKNSWGSTWGPTGDGYGYCLYGTIEGHDRIHALTGNPWIAIVPLPGAVLLGLLGLSVAGVKLRKFA